MNVRIGLTVKQISDILGHKAHHGDGINTCALLRTGRWQVIEGPDFGLIFDRPLWVGSIAGRHEGMNCDWYVWEKSEEMFGQEIVDATVARIDEFMREYPLIKEIRFRYTGRTDITLAIVAAFQKHKVMVWPETFIHKTGQYEPLNLP